MKRDILNFDGQKIGELELPDDTPEEVWSKKLATYAQSVLPAIPPISPRQIRLQLLKMGLTNQDIVSAIEAAIPEPDRTKALIEWEYSVSFERRAPFVDAVGLLLGLNSTQLDALWLDAGAQF